MAIVVEVVTLDASLRRRAPWLLESAARSRFSPHWGSRPARTRVRIINKQTFEKPMLYRASECQKRATSPARVYSSDVNHGGKVATTGSPDTVKTMPVCETEKSLKVSIPAALRRREEAVRTTCCATNVIAGLREISFAQHCFAPTGFP